MKDKHINKWLFIVQADQHGGHIIAIYPAKYMNRAIDFLRSRDQQSNYIRRARWKGWGEFPDVQTMELVEKQNTV